MFTRSLPIEPALLGVIPCCGCWILFRERTLRSACSAVSLLRSALIIRNNCCSSPPYAAHLSAGAFRSKFACGYSRHLATVKLVRPFREFRMRLLIRLLPIYGALLGRRFACRCKSRVRTRKQRRARYDVRDRSFDIFEQLVAVDAVVVLVR